MEYTIGNSPLGVFFPTNTGWHICSVHNCALSRLTVATKRLPEVIAVVATAVIVSIILDSLSLFNKRIFDYKSNSSAIHLCFDLELYRIFLFFLIVFIYGIHLAFVFQYIFVIFFDNINIECFRIEWEFDVLRRINSSS